MKTIRRCMCFLAACLPVVSLNALEASAQGSDLSDFHIERFSALVAEVGEFHALARQQAATTEDLRQAFSDARAAYKRVEYLVDFHYTPYNQLFINGTPFEKYDYESSGAILPPQGFQRLDELLYLEDPQSSRAELVQVAGMLDDRLAFLHTVYSGTRFEPAISIEAIRSGLVRLFALGLTGFDTPGSPDALAEGRVALAAMQEHFAMLKPGETARDVAYERADDLFTRGIKRLDTRKSFERFDRLSFLLEVINPLYASLRDFQSAGQNGFSQYKVHAQNLAAGNLFAADFLDPYFYNQTSLVPLDKPDSAALGERLFSDLRLSRAEELSCASCHRPERAFSDGLPTSRSNRADVFQDRNTPTLLNAVYSTRQFWDMRAYDLERQVVHVADNEREFNLALGDIAQRLSRDAEYEAAFKRIYSDFEPPIQPRTISNAIAAYVAALRSFNSPFDRYVRGESDKLPRAARRGFNVFMGKAGCGSCHFAPLFNGTVPPFYTDTESEVLGVTVGFDPAAPVLDDDPGRAANGIPRDGKLGHFNRSFKTVSLRDVERTAPYMHNGSFETLEDVVEFYDLGGGRGLGLDVENQTLPEEALELSERDKRDLVEFMKALTEPVTHEVQ